MPLAFLLLLIGRGAPIESQQEKEATATTAAEIEKRAVEWLRRNPEQRRCLHHWAVETGLPFPEHEQALGSLLRTIRAVCMEFPGLVVADGVCPRCELTGDPSVKPLIWKVRGEDPWPLLGRGRWGG